MFTYPQLSNKKGHIKAYPDLFSLPGQSKNETEKWCTQAKLDGANFQIYFDTSLKYASRNIDNVGPVWKQANLVPEVIEVSKVLPTCAKPIAIRILEDDVKSVHVFGELYGGSIRGMIQYSGRQKFTIFDIVVRKNNDEFVILSAQEAELFCTELGLTMIPILAKGTLCEMLEIDPETFQAEYEGGVIKPYNFRASPKKNSQEYVTWPFVKNKKQAYLERQEAKPKAENKAKQTFFNLLTRERCLTNLNKQTWESQEQFFNAIIQDARADDEEDLFLSDKVADYQKKLASFKIKI